MARPQVADGGDGLQICRDRCVDNIKIDLREDGMVWTGSIWLRIKTSGWLL
jgi:hypothetical protein